MYYPNHLVVQNRLSRHAQVRMQQRSIPQFIVDCLLDFADPVPAGSGDFEYSFKTDSWAEAQQYMGSKTRKLDRYRNTYVIVCSDGTVKTASHKHRKFFKEKSNSQIFYPNRPH